MLTQTYACINSSEYVAERVCFVSMLPRAVLFTNLIWLSYFKSQSSVTATSVKHLFISEI